MRPLYIGGFDVNSDQVQTLAYACLTGNVLADVLKQTGIKIGQKIATASIEIIPERVLISLNQKGCFRLGTKFGIKGNVNLVKMIQLLVVTLVENQQLDKSMEA